ncbi:DpnII family type II restriction endonuclease [Mycobacterium simiae]|uniref:DpnII family type II restriction endonuclease n=1 Tax=Mycobacterium simiae TaxID=1784 RepID=UPI002616D8E4|nr:DpnII family type II restriction endonuclease [Mycobacterium simiae]
MSTPVSFEQYLDALGAITPHVDPTTTTPQTQAIRAAVDSLQTITPVTGRALAQWAHEHPRWAYVLGLVVGLSQEKLLMALKDGLGTSGAITLARDRSEELITFLDDRFDVIEMVNKQADQEYGLADVLIARAGPRVTATRATAAGRSIEDMIEDIAKDLGLSYSTRTRFVGRGDQTGPADLVIPDSAHAVIMVAAKGFDSTGSKLTAAYEEIAKMAAVRKPTQFVMAVVDGIGWKSRKADLRRIHDLWTTNDIDGLYTVSTLGQFRADLQNAARLRGLV